MKPYAKNSFWFSKLSDALTCPQKYKLKYIDEIPPDEVPSGDMHFGTALHTALHSEFEDDTGLLTFHMYWDSINPDKCEWGRFKYDDLRYQGEILINKFIKNHKKHFKPLYMEQRLFGKIGKHKFEGTPDFIGEYKGNLTLVDWKTSGYRYDKDKIYNAEQLMGYVYLAQKEYGIKIDQIMYLTFVKGTVPSVQNPIILKLTDDMLNNTIKNIESIIEDLTARQFFPKNSRSCSFGKVKCPYFERCWKNDKKD